jgi:hypothetical protein
VWNLEMGGGVSIFESVIVSVSMSMGARERKSLKGSMIVSPGKISSTPTLHIADFENTAAPSES